MIKIVKRLEEMPYNMLVRVARKFRLSLDVEEERVGLIERLENVISDYLLEKKNDADVCIDGSLAKYSLLADFEVPHELAETNDMSTHHSSVTYIDLILIDKNWCYIYWDLSHHDYDKIKKSDSFIELEVHVLYNKNGFHGNYKSYDDKDVCSVSLLDFDRNFYHEECHTYAGCLLVATYKTGKQLLAASGEVFLPHMSPVYKRYSVSDEQLELLRLATKRSSETEDEDDTFVHGNQDIGEEGGVG